VTVSEPQRDEPGFEAFERRRFDDELIGLDRDDPEVRAFVEHLERTHRQRPGFTVEGYLGGVADFAESITRSGGGRRLAAIVVVALLLLGAVFAVWEALVFVLSTFAAAVM
jgi:hypothetical protein